MLQPGMKWLVVLIVSTLVLIWRLIDFARETIDGEFGMNRGGFLLMGTGAKIIELIIIFVCIAVIGYAIVNLVRLYRPGPPGDRENR